MRRTQDETSWVTNWEEEHVPAEGSRGDKTPVPSRVPGNGSSSGAGTSTSVGGLTGVDGSTSVNDGGNSSGGLTTANNGTTAPNNGGANTTTTISQITTTRKIDPTDKPLVRNTANLIRPFTTKSDSQAETLRNKVLNSKDNLNITGTKYYISNKGNDNNDGKSPQTAWATLTKLSNSSGQLRAGDAVLFERGGVYRGVVRCVSGITYGAYGTGDKPCIYQSAQNYATTKWAKDSGNIWIAPRSLSNVGIVVFNHGEQAGIKKFSKAELAQNGDFYSGSDGKLYLYMDMQPADKFYSIEIGTQNHIFYIAPNYHDIRIDNLTVKYGGAHGVSASGPVRNVSVTNCEIGWVGGSVLTGYGDGNVRYGNGVEFWRGCENIRVENNWIYQIYDSGFTHQGNGDAFEVKNLVFTGNLIEYTAFGSIEYWAPGANHKIINVEYSNNICRFAGYGWGYNGQSAAHIVTTDNLHTSQNFVIKNNIFDTALKDMIKVIHRSGTLPALSGNTFIGKEGDRLGSFGVSSTSKRYFFRSTTQSEIRTAWGDATAIVLFNN